MKKPICSLLALFLMIFVCPSESSRVKNQKWKGEIEFVDGIKVVNNPKESVYGEISFELEEDLSIGNEDDDNYLFYRIRDIDVDDMGNIFVADMSNFRIQKFDKDGKYLQTIGGQGQGPGEFDLPVKVRIDKRTGNIYVRDRAYGIEIFDDQGNFKEGFKIERSFSDFQLDENGNIIGVFRMFSDTSQTNAVCKVNTEGKIIETYAEFPYNLFREKRSGGVLMVSTGWEKDLYISKLNDKTFVYGYPETYELFVIDNTGQILFKLTKDSPHRRFQEDQRNKLKKFNLGEFQPFFYSILTDSEERIYVQTNNTESEDEVMEREVDIFSKDGQYLYKTTLPKLTYVIKNGYLYAHIIEEDIGLELVKRFKINNWEQISRIIK